MHHSSAAFSGGMYRIVTTSDKTPDTSTTLICCLHVSLNPWATKTSSYVGGQNFILQLSVVWLAHSHDCSQIAKKIQENDATKEEAPFNCFHKSSKANKSIFNKWKPIELMSQFHRCSPLLKIPSRSQPPVSSFSPLCPRCQHKYHQVQTRSSKKS